MAVSGRGGVSFDLKSTALTGLALVLRTADIGTLGAAMAERFGDGPAVFDHEMVVIDLSGLPPDTPSVDFPALSALLKTHRLQAVGVRGATESTREAAAAAGLADVADDLGPVAVASRPAPAPASLAAPTPATPPAAEIHPAASAPTASPHVPALIVDRPLRSGQQVYARGGDLVVLATVNVGAEVIADGSIHVYGPLRGKAVAGAKGDAHARIFSTCMEPQLVSIAGTYRTTETPLPAEVVGKPAQIRLDGERLVFEPLG